MITECPYISRWRTDLLATRGENGLEDDIRFLCLLIEVTPLLGRDADVITGFGQHLTQGKGGEIKFGSGCKVHHHQKVSGIRLDIHLVTVR